MFGRLLRIAVPVMVAAAAGLAAAAGTGQAAGAPGWRIVASVPDGAYFGALTATGPASAWTAGSVCVSSSCLGTTLVVRHWNGKAWQAIAVPKAFVDSADFAGPVSVAAAGTSAWILDAGQTSTGAETTAVLHWTGNGWGKTVMLPASINSAVAPTATDVWAFGTGGPVDSPYAAHYNGKTWAAERVPVGGDAASATSDSNIWVLGTPAVAPPGADLAIMSFNGKTWRKTSLPSVFNGPVAAISIAAVSAVDVWATGEILVPGPSLPPVLLHWNGKKWAEITVPYNGFNGALALDGHGGVWLAVGDMTPPAEHGYLLHYGSGKWSRVTAPASRGEIDIPNVLAWIPGTRSLWGTGNEMPAGSSGPSPAVILKDGL
jgi:hypothetical protein